jgi:hypothetical protein
MSEWGGITVGSGLYALRVLKFILSSLFSHVFPATWVDFWYWRSWFVLETFPYKFRLNAVIYILWEYFTSFPLCHSLFYTILADCKTLPAFWIFSIQQPMQRGLDFGKDPSELVSNFHCFCEVRVDSKPSWPHKKSLQPILNRSLKFLGLWMKCMIPKTKEPQLLCF